MFRSLQADHHRLAYSFSFLFLVTILSIKTLVGIDLSDEMQYYGQVSSLLNTNSLFGNDLFIQQLVYLPFYPLLKIHHFFYGTENLVFAIRILLGFLITAMFVFSYKRLNSLSSNKIIASLVALALTFSITFHGIFSISYNTISQLLWVLFLIYLYDWKNRNTLVISLLISLMGFAHPISCIALFLIYSARLIKEGKYLELVKLNLYLLILLVLVSLMLLQVTTPSKLISSINFSMGFEVGSTFFSSYLYIIILCLVLLILLLPFVKLPTFFYRPIEGKRFFLLFPLLSILSIILFVVDYRYYGYSPWTVLIFSALLFPLCLKLSHANKYPQISKSNGWLFFAFAIYLLVLSVTSGNGIAQAVGSLMVFIPITMFLALKDFKASYSNSLFISLPFLFLLLTYIIHWSNYPYRESHAWDSLEKIEDVPEFNFIRTSENRINFIKNVKENFHFLENNDSLIVSRFPALYFMLNTKPETCMFYMHSIRSDKAEMEVLSCLENKNPTYILNIYDDSLFKDEFERKINQTISVFTEKSGYQCSRNQLRFSITNEDIHNPSYIDYELCRI